MDKIITVKVSDRWQKRLGVKVYKNNQNKPNLITTNLNCESIQLKIYPANKVQETQDTLTKFDLAKYDYMSDILHNW